VTYLRGFLFLGLAIVIAAVVALVFLFLALAIFNLVTRRPFWTDMRHWLAYPLIAILIILPMEGFYFFASSRGVNQHETFKWLSIIITAVFVFGYAIKAYWLFRKRWTFWLVLSVLAATHFFVLSRLPWQRAGASLIYVIGIPELALVGFLLGLIFLRKPFGSEHNPPSEQSEA
jgi:hypothetical protein